MINQVTLIGNLGIDAELKDANGTPVVRFTMATNENYEKNGEWQTVTQWHNVTAWRQLAERYSDLRKGEMVFVFGKIKYRKYTDPQGVEKWQTNIEARTIRRLDKREQT